jgi:hypothetical protein
MGRQVHPCHPCLWSLLTRGWSSGTVLSTHTAEDKALLRERRGLHLTSGALVATVQGMFCPSGLPSQPNQGHHGSLAITGVMDKEERVGLGSQ